MYYNPLGKTGKQVSAISLGGMRYIPEDYKDGPEKCAEIVLRAMELGVNLFDTAPGYSDDASEDILGCALRQVKEKPYVSTKCGLWMATTAQGAYDAVRKSIDRIGVEQITFYHMWCACTLEDYGKMIAPGGIYEGMLRAKEEGLIEHICLSTHLDGGDIEKIVHDGRFESVILGYNAINFAFRRAGVKACYDAGLGVMAMNPLGGGTIPQYEDVLSFLKSAPDETIVHAALRFLLGQKEVSCALPGVGTIAELEECVSAAYRRVEIGEAYFDELKTRFQSNSLCTSCAYCMPCPVGVPIVQLLTAYNEYLVRDDREKMLEFIKGHWTISAAEAGNCTGCGACEGLCTQKLPIMERLGHIADWAQDAK